MSIHAGYGMSRIARIIFYLQELNCCPAGGGLEGFPDPDPPNPPPKDGADPEAMDPNVGALAALPKVGALPDTLPNVDPPPPNVAPMDGAAPKLDVDPKAGGEPNAGGDPKVAAPPNPAEGLVGVLLLFCWNPKP